MYTFPELMKKIREEAGLTQSEFAGILDVSSVLIAMIETGQKEVSKKMLLKLAEVMKVRPSSITPFLFTNENRSPNSISPIEKTFIRLGEKMQEYLIENRAKRLRVYAKK